MLMKVLAALALVPVVALGFQGSAKPTFAKNVGPFLKKNCVSCHSGPYAADKVDFSKITTEAEAVRQLKLLKKSAGQVKNKSMPPKGSVMPTDADRKAFTDWVSAKGK